MELAFPSEVNIQQKTEMCNPCRFCKAEMPCEAVYCPVCGKKQARAPHTPKKRGNGTGSVYRLPNGKWRAERTLEPFMDYEKQKCYRRRVTRSDFTTKRDALQYLSILGTELDTRKTTAAARLARQSDKTMTTLKQLYDLWLPSCTRSKSTVNCYQAGFAVFRDCWNTPMKDMDIDDLQACLDDCGKGRRTQENARTALGLVYKYGIPRGYVPANVSGEPNLARFLTICDAEKGKHKDGMTELDLERLRGAVPRLPYAGYILCHCYLGFRPAAFLGLTVASYDASERAFTGGIKTVAGIDRTVTVSPKIQPYIDALIAGRTEGPIFRDLSTGRELTMKRYRAIFYETLDAVGIQPLSDPPHRLTPHSCRHTFATLMKRVEAPEKDKLALIGHTEAAMLRHYQDVNFDDLRRITDAI